MACLCIRACPMSQNDCVTWIAARYVEHVEVGAVCEKATCMHDELCEQYGCMKTMTGAVCFSPALLAGSNRDCGDYKRAT